MRCKTVVILAILLAVSATAVLAETDGSSAADTVTLSGVVGTPGESSCVGLSGVEVKVYKTDELNTPIGTSTTDSTGYFTVDVSNDGATNLKMSLTKEGYAVFNYPTALSKDADGYLNIDLNSLSEVSGCYVITTAGDLEHCIVMSDAEINIKFLVSGANDKSLRHAEISLYQDGDKKYSEKTDDNGTCTIKDIQVGEYSVKIICNGYEDYSKNISITTTDKDTQMSFVLEEKEIATYGGMTTYHILMIAGVFIGIILVAAAYALCARNWREIDRGDLQD